MLTLKHPLAFNVDRDPIAVPGNAFAWRVRYVPRGSLAAKVGDAPVTAVLGDGTPVYLPIKASPSELRRVVSADGLYRLDAVNPALRVLANVEPAYVEIATPISISAEGLVLGFALAVGVVCLSPNVERPAPATAPRPLPRTQTAPAALVCTPAVPLLPEGPK